MKKIISLILALLTVLSLFISCVGDASTPSESDKISESDTPSAGNSESESNADIPPETEEKPYNSSTALPDDLNYNDKEVQFVSREYSIYNHELTVEGTNGDPINDALFTRNALVEATLGVTIVNNKMAPGGSHTNNFDIINKVKNEMGANSFNYDIMFNPSYACVFRTSDALWEDLTTISNLDLSREYWSNLYNDQVRIGNRQYFTTGPIVLSLQRMTFATIFNKTLTQKYGIDNLYDVVKDGHWTIDYQSQIVSNAYDDIDGEDGRTDGDFYGFISNTNFSTDPYWTAWNISVFHRTDDDYLAYDFNIEQASNFVLKVIEFYWDNEGVHLYLPEGEAEEQAKIRKHFADGRAIMAQLRLMELENEDMRTMEDPYGIIPLPKFEENNEPYYSAASDSFTCISVLKGQSNDDLEMCGAVLELLACESYNIVQPAYFEVALKGKYSKDEESWEMLDQIMKNFRVDQDFLYTTTDTTDIVQKFRDAVYGKNRNFASSFAMQEPRMKRSIELLIQKIRDME